MTGPDAMRLGTPPPPTPPAWPTALATMYRLLLRGQLTRLRALGLLTLGAIGILLAAVARGADDPLEASAELMAGYGLGVVAPVCTLWVATSLLGDLIEDDLVAYLWLKPISRWVLPTAAVGASLTIMIPLVIAPLTIAAAVSGSGDVIIGTVVAAGLAVLAYSGLFVAIGARFNRALWWGLLYILVWENAVALISDGTARLAVRSYVVSVLARATGVDITVDGRSAIASVLVPVLMAVAGIGVSTWFLRTRDID